MPEQADAKSLTLSAAGDGLTTARMVEIIVGAVVVAALVAVAWAGRVASPDVYTALAGGRDILAGRLGQPDDWAFTTGGAIWIDQNWGTHLVYAVFARLGGEEGLLLLKGINLALVAVFVVSACQERGVGRSAAMLVAGGVILASRSYLDPRPNLVTLAFVPLVLWLLYRSRAGGRWVWLTAPVMLAWANMHGGFMFGLGMTGLWAVVWLGVAARREGVVAAVRRYWPLGGATVAAIAVAAFANPFGVTNVTHPFLVAGVPAWQEVAEWLPVFTDSPVKFATVWEFFVVLGVLAALLVGRLAARSAASTQQEGDAKPSAADVSQTLFDIVLSAVVIAMAFKARRFIPLAMIVLAPVIAIHLQWALRLGLRPWPTVAAAAALLAAAGGFAWHLTHTYSRENPLYPRQSFFERMVAAESLGTGVAKFAGENGFEGRVFNTWEWESMLRLACPELKLFSGCRAQQIYPEWTEQVRGAVLEGDDAQKLLADLQIGFVAVPFEETYVSFLEKAVFRPDSRWAFVYYDGWDALLVDASRAQVKPLIEAIRRRALAYPDDGTYATSLAMCLASTITGTPPEVVLEACKRAGELNPSPWVYVQVYRLVTECDLPAEKAIAYYEAERRRLAKLDHHQPLGIRILESRQSILAALERLYASEDLVVEASETAQERQNLSLLISEVSARWQ